jgi:hypothetical protein
MVDCDTDPRPHHFAELRDSLFRPSSPCQAPRYTRSRYNYSQSRSPVYMSYKGLFTAFAVRGEIRQRLLSIRIVRETLRTVF